MPKERYLDVSELEAPKPLIEALRAIEQLDNKEILLFKHRMKPLHLFDRLRELNLKYEILQEVPGDFLMRIWRADVSRT